MKIPHMIHSNGRVDCRIVFALTACLCLFAAQSGAQLDAKIKAHPSRVLVRFKARALDVDLNSTPLGIRLANMPQTAPYSSDGKQTGNIDWETVDYLSKKIPVAYDIVDGSSVNEKVEQLNKRGDVAIAEPDYEVKIYRRPKDPMFKYQWHHPMIQSNSAWDEATGSKDVKVCVIDSGTDMNHPDLAGNIAKGWNVVPRNSAPNYPSPGSVEWSNFNDTLGHGTHVTGLVGAVANNGKGVSGVSWKKEGAHIYSNSWGGVGYSDMLLQEIKTLKNKNALFVVAAGNNNGLDLDKTPLYPAAYEEDNVLTIASTTSQDTLSAFSNIGMKHVHLAAPGSSIFSTTFDGSYGTMSGTSMATPIVASAAALLKSVAIKKNYDLSAAELKLLLIDNADAFKDGDKYTSSGGRLNVRRALRALKSSIKGSNAPSATQPPISTPEQARKPEINPPSGPSLETCGSSIIRGRPARQSSTYKMYNAENAVNGDCRSQASRYASACAITAPGRSYPWWTSTLPAEGHVASVSITTRSDCCSSTIGGAWVMVGNQTWDGSGDRKRFTLCGKVPVSPNNSRIKVQCSSPIEGTDIAIYLPKKKAVLSLCEVDAFLQESVPKSQHQDCIKPRRK